MLSLGMINHEERYKPRLDNDFERLNQPPPPLIGLPDLMLWPIRAEKTQWKRRGLRVNFVFMDPCSGPVFCG